MESASRGLVVKRQLKLKHFGSLVVVIVNVGVELFNLVIEVES